MTEHLILGTDWEDNLSTGRDMLDCLNAGMSAYIWWYIVRFYGPIYDEGTDYRTPPGAVKGEISKRGYVMSQFARFIRPGYYRVNADIPNGNISISAFKDSTSSKIVIVAINIGYSATDQTFVLQNGSAESFMRYVTSESKDCEQGNDITVSGDSFTATLEKRSVTTFVGDWITGTDENITKPVSYGLYQNYPNPFNPLTTIKYSIPEKAFVSLIIYNLLGEEIVSLFEGEMNAGMHAVNFDGANLPSGIYLCQMRSNNFIESKKLVLLK
jgi:glucuronoarabinoxylan endo-1,4-beta-xylanase